MDKTLANRTSPGPSFQLFCGCASTWINTCTSSKPPNLQLKTQPKLVLGSLLLAFELPALFLYWPVVEAQWQNIHLINPRSSIRVLATAAYTGREGMFKKVSSLYILDIKLRNQQKKLFYIRSGIARYVLRPSSFTSFLSKGTAYFS